MKRTAVMMFLIALAGVPAMAAGAEPPAPPEPATPPLPDRAALEADLDRARADLDAAAARLGELHRQLYAVETMGVPGRRPMLGVLLGERGPNGGLLLAGVTPGGGAEAAGLKAGDELLAVNGVDLTGDGGKLGALREAMEPVAPGDVVQVSFERDGGVQVVDLTTEARGAYFMGMTGIPPMDPEKLQTMVSGVSAITADTSWVESLDALENLESLENIQEIGDAPRLVHRALRIAGPGGLRLEDISADLGHYFGVESGVLVMDASPTPDGTPVLKAGDILLAVNGAAIDDAGHGYEALFAAPDEGDPAAVRTVEVLRDGVRETVTLPSGYPAGAAHRITIRKGDAANPDVRVIRSGPS